MASAIQAVSDKYKRLGELWKSKQLQQLLSDGYTDDATFVDGTSTFKGHAELSKLFQKFMDDGAGTEYTVIDTSATSDDTVVQRTKSTENGKDVKFKLTWTKVGGDWKVSREELI